MTVTATNDPSEIAPAPLPRRELALLTAIWFASGSAALIYQVLWVRGLGLLFGSTAEAAAITIAIFFGGMMAGGWYWGRRAPRFKRALLVFGIVELGVAATALGHFLLLDTYHALYPGLYALVGHARAIETLAKAAVAATILFPAAFLMGGTLPLMGQYLVRRREQLGTTGSALYAVNTAGGAIGALAAGFVLPLSLGFVGAYLLAVAIDTAVGATAIAMALGPGRAGDGENARAPGEAREEPHGGDLREGRMGAAQRFAKRGQPDRPERRAESSGTPGVAPPPESSGVASGSTRKGSGRRTRAATDANVLARTTAGRSPLARGGPRLALPPRLVWLVAFASGLATLGIEVVWTRLFSQVLQNSAYTYSLVLTAFLLALALGSTLANALARLRRPTPAAVLCALLGLSLLVTLASPWLFHRFTGGLGYLGGEHGWSAYVVDVAMLATQAMLIPGIALGAVLPYLLRALQGSAHAPGEAIGRLVAANTAGAMFGSLAAGFLLLPAFGVTRSLMILGAVYAALLAVVAWRGGIRVGRPVAGVAGAAAIALLILPPPAMNTITLDSARGERLLELREGTAAHVAVVERNDGLAMRVNNYYVLGSTGTMEFERNQAIIPMLTHPAPRSIFFLGMGTGLSAGAALYFPVDRVVVCELLPDVIDLSRRHFGPWLNGLFGDPRVTIHAEDGRNCLRRSRDRYDVIVSDLFTPWHAGTGNLYTVEHYRAAMARLEPEGIYAQWVALHQVSDAELGIIARTMQEVFPRVVMWRGDLAAEQSIVALVGQAHPAPLDPSVLARNVRTIGGDAAMPEGYAEELVLPFYAGNLSDSGLFDDRRLNTDDHPIIEYLAPRTYRAVMAGEAEWLVGAGRDSLYRRLLAAAPPEEDAYLARLSPEQIEHVRAGLEAATGGRGESR